MPVANHETLSMPILYMLNCDVTVKVGSQYNASTRHAREAMPKRKDRVDFYSCVTDAVLDESDFICQIPFFILKPLDTAACVHNYCEMTFTENNYRGNYSALMC